MTFTEKKDVHIALSAMKTAHLIMYLCGKSERINEMEFSQTKGIEDYEVIAYDNLDLPEDEKLLTPQQYFDVVKDRKSKATDEQLRAIYDNCLELLNKYKITNQHKCAAKLIFHLECIEKEREIVSMGIDTFVYRDDIEYYIDNVASNVVKIIELENYEREIPDEIVEIIAKVKDKFDQMYVVFTDYTGEVERQVEKERRAKDPILFGTFQSQKDNVVIDRFYYLGDWVDEYCDLTLDKMVNETEREIHRNIEHTIRTPEDINELKEQLSTLVQRPGSRSGFVMTQKPEKKSFFESIKTFFTRRK